MTPRKLPSTIEELDAIVAAGLAEVGHLVGPTLSGEPGQVSLLPGNVSPQVTHRAVTLAYEVIGLQYPSFDEFMAWRQTSGVPSWWHAERDERLAEIRASQRAVVG